MRWIVTLLVLAGAGAGIWWWATQTDERPSNGDYVFDVETGEVVAREGAPGIERKKVEPLGIIGESAHPREPLGEMDVWMSAELILPKQPAISGEVLLRAMSKITPIRFRTHTEMAAFGAQQFELGTESGDAVHGHLFESLVEHAGFKMQLKSQFLFVYDPEQNKVFRDQMLRARKRRQGTEGASGGDDPASEQDPAPEGADKAPAKSR